MILSKAEKSYIQSSLLSDPPLRPDGRSPRDYRPIALETGVVPLANGSAKVCIGRPGRGGYVQEAGGVGGGTEVVVGVKLEVAGAGEGGKVACTVSWWVISTRSPSPWGWQTDSCLAVPLRHIPRCPRTHWTTSNRI